MHTGVRAIGQGRESARGGAGDRAWLPPALSALGRALEAKPARGRTDCSSQAADPARVAARQAA